VDQEVGGSNPPSCTKINSLGGNGTPEVRGSRRRAISPPRRFASALTLPHISGVDLPRKERLNAGRPRKSPTPRGPTHNEGRAGSSGQPLPLAALGSATGTVESALMTAGRFDAHFGSRIGAKRMASRAVRRYRSSMIPKSGYRFSEKIMLE